MESDVPSLNYERGESAVEDVGSPEKGGKDFSGYDPVLAARLARQQKKAMGEMESDVPSLNYEKPSTEAKPNFSGMDPVLARRLAKQQEKTTTGESAVEDVGSHASQDVKLDPVLQRRFTEQREKVRMGTGSVTDVGSAAEKIIHLDPLLQKRLQQQEQKELTGEGTAVDLEKKRVSREEYSEVNPELAEKLHARQEAINPTPPPPPPPVEEKKPSVKEFKKQSALQKIGSKCCGIC